MGNEFKIILVKFLKFITIFILMDFGLGSLAEILFFSQESGKYARITYALEKASDDIFVFGNSLANRHYIPRVFEDELNLTCYNAGVQGQDLLFLYLIEKIILKRTTPKLIILNLDFNWFYNFKKSSDLLSDLHPYFFRYQNILKSDMESENECLKLYFKSYRLNSTIAHIIKYYLIPQEDNKGYNPLFSSMTQPKDTSLFKLTNYSETKLDSSCVQLLVNFIIETKKKNIDLLFVISPKIQSIDISSNIAFDKIKGIAASFQVPIIDFSNDSHFKYHYNLFYDPSHLNNNGACLFSKLLAERIKERTQLNPNNTFTIKNITSK